jgi:probable F420-dependent oxidoreductase
MRLGLVASNVGPDCIRTVREVPGFAESMGFSSVWFTDHVIGLKAYQPVYRGEWAELLTSMTWAAAHTTSIRVACGVMAVPYRDPVLAAKMLATLDHLSGGRLIVGLGTGWAYREFEALGKGPSFERRGAATDEAIDVMLRCWQGGTFGYQGEFTSFKEIEFAPTPVQQPHPPLWVGGQTGRALRRAAKYADVWHPTRISPAEVRDGGERLDELAGRRVTRSIRLALSPDTQEEILATVDEYLAIGCEDFVVEIKRETTDEILREAERLAIRFDLQAPRPVG